MFIEWIFDVELELKVGRNGNNGYKFDYIKKYWELLAHTKHKELYISIVTKKNIKKKYVMKNLTGISC